MQPIRLEDSLYDVEVHQMGETTFLSISYQNTRMSLTPKAVHHLQQIISNRLTVETVTTYTLNDEL